MILSYERHGTAFTVDTDELDEKAIAYLLQYGWAQSLQDSVAGRAKKVKDELQAKDTPAAEIQEAIESDELGTMQKRIDAILAGTIGTIRQARDPFGSMVAKVAKELLAAYAKSKARKLPKVGSDEYKALVEKFTAANKEKIEAEAKLRLERNAGLVDESDEIFD